MNASISDNKELYDNFCKHLFVPIYAKTWYMDAVCGAENWDVWFYYSGDEIVAAMPYYTEKRKEYKYITRPLLTQNNGIIFRYPDGSGRVARAKFEERVIDAACDFIDEMGLDVFEEQFHWSFENWLPFFWRSFTAITRYTYIIEDTTDLNKVWEGITSKQRSIIKKGQKNSVAGSRLLDKTEYYENYVKIFDKQDMECPYSFDLWNRVYDACTEHSAGRILFRETDDERLACLSFVIWDEKYLYKIMGGPMPELSHLDAYAAVTWDEICLAHDMGLGFDFEGSVVKRISKSFREYGGEAKRYYRIRKIYNKSIAEIEMNDYMARVQNSSNRGDMNTRGHV